VARRWAEHGRERARTRERAAQWAEPEGEKDRPEFGFLFFFFKILNSVVICLFH
jgi:hypothetical protein